MKGRVLLDNLVHVASNHAARPVKTDVRKTLESVQAVLRVGMEIFVPRSVAQDVSRAVINSMETVCVNQAGKEIDVPVC